MPDMLSFLIKPLDDHRPEVLTLTPVINDVLLTTLIAGFERKHAMDPAGGYGGLVPAFFRYGPLDLYFLGKSKDGYFNTEGECYVLGCQCGEVGCWPLSARIATNERQIVWNHFAQEHRLERDYSGFGPFTFERVAYTKTVQEVAAQFPAKI